MSLTRELKDHVRSVASEFSRSLNAGGSEAADISALVSATSHLPLSNLETLEQLIRLALQQAEPPPGGFWNKPAPCVTWAHLCSGNGFVRERALRTLSGPAPNRFFFAMAARRLNDWVPQVRLAARERLPAMASSSNPAHVADVLCALFPHWGSWGRLEYEERRVLLEVAALEKIAHALKSRLVSGTTGQLAAVLVQLGRIPLLDEYLPEIARDAVQPSVRARAYRFLLGGKSVWPVGRKWEWIDVRYCVGHFKLMFDERPLCVTMSLEENLSAAAADRSVFVRRVAAETLIRKAENIGPIGVRLAKVLASDPNQSVAERGFFALKKLCGTMQQ